MADGDGATMQMGNPVKAVIGEEKRNAKYVIVAAQVHNGQLARGRRQMRNCARAWVHGQSQMGGGKWAMARGRIGKWAMAKGQMSKPAKRP